MEQQPLWEKKHRRYIAEKGLSGHSLFAEQVVGLLRPGSEILELGSGYGQDAIYLARHGNRVIATDFSNFALSQVPEESREFGVTPLLLDIVGASYPFSNGTFDAVYAHLSLHYFPTDVTTRIFEEISRILKLGGQFFGLFNSVRDSEFGCGIELEDSFYQQPSGERKRFFSAEEFPQLLPRGLTVTHSEYGSGTRNNKGDQYVILIAAKVSG